VVLSLHEEITVAERRIHVWHRSNQASRRLATIPGIGPIIATALVASVSDPSVFKSGREMAAWIGLVPRQDSTGGKQRMGRISKQGDHYLRWLLVAGAMSVIRHGRRTNFEKNPWLGDLVQHKPTKVAAVALANKIARTAWAVLVTGETYRQPAPAEV
jgi:transposase